MRVLSFQNTMNHMEDTKSNNGIESTPPPWIIGIPLSGASMKKSISG